MTSKIYCIPSDKGIHTFYLLHDGEKIFLFNQAYRKSVQDYFGKERTINESMKAYKVRSRDGAKKDRALRRTAHKIPLYLKYIEKEYEIQVLDKSKRKENCK